MNFTDHAQISAIHFADDSTFYKSFKAIQVNQVAKELEKTILNQFKIDQIRETWFSMPLKQNQCYFWNRGYQNDLSFSKKTRLPWQRNRTCTVN